MILDRIIDAKKSALGRHKKMRSLAFLQERIGEVPPPRDFKGAVESAPCAVIAEVKRSSPSKGRIKEDFDPRAIARAYERGGAAALSVLTEEDFFEGTIEYLLQIGQVASIPLLRKDFIIDPYQIYETRAFAGDALLLIARMLETDRLAEFIALTESLGMVSLVEVHDRAELDRALEAKAPIIGINNRDLATFATDLAVSAELAAHVPQGVCVVSESGIRSRKDVLFLMERGIHAFLVGEFLMRSDDMTAALGALMGKEGCP